MEEKNELNDIILNKSGGSGGNKKLLLAVATLALILIIVIVIMNSLKSEGTQNLPQAVLPPEPQAPQEQVAQNDDPLFEPVEVIEETPVQNDDLSQIAKKLKEESQQEHNNEIVEEEVVIVEPEPLTPPAPQVSQPKPEPKPVAVTPKPKPKPTPAPAPKPKSTTGKQFYVQVGSFSRLKPSSAFLKKVEQNGFSYSYHQVKRNGTTVNKVLIGPFKNEAAARKALGKIRKTIESGAFLLKV